MKYGPNVMSPRSSSDLFRPGLIKPPFFSYDDGGRKMQNKLERGFFAGKVERSVFKTGSETSE